MKIMLLSQIILGDKAGGGGANQDFSPGARAATTATGW